MLNMIIPIGSLAIIALLILIAYAGKNNHIKERHLKKAWKRYQKNQRLMQRGHQ